MKNKKQILLGKIISYIKRNPDNLSYISIKDIIAYLFLMKKLPNPTNSIMKKKWRAKKHHSVQLINILLEKSKIRYGNKQLGNLISNV